MMEYKIKAVAKEAGFSQDQYTLYWDEDSNADGVDLDKFAELIIEECCKALSPALRDMISRGRACELIKEHFDL